MLPSLFFYQRALGPLGGGPPLPPPRPRLFCAAKKGGRRLIKVMSNKEKVPYGKTYL